MRLPPAYQIQKMAEGLLLMVDQWILIIDSIEISKSAIIYIQNYRAHDIVSWLNNLKNLQGIRVITNYCIWGVNHQDLIMPSIENVKAAVIVADSFKQRCLHLSSNWLEYYINLHDFNYLKAIRVTLLLLF